MAVLALVAYLTFIGVAFGWRMWLQRRRTGDSGLRGLSRTAPEILAGIALFGGAIAAFLAPVAELAGALPLLRPLDRPAARVAAGMLLLVGFLVTVLAQLQMGSSWRIGVDPQETTRLVTDGVFRYVRNPIYCGMLFALAGLALLVPNVLSFAGGALVAAGLEIQVRFVEEPHLARVQGERYRSYARSVGRFVPRVGRAS